jgi:uncharacterized lipoprotein YmbA
MIRKILSAWAWPMTILVLSGCAGTPPSSFFALTPGAAEVVGTGTALVLAVGPIDLPRYLDRPQIVSRGGGNRLEVDEFHRWGGALEEEIARVLTNQLGESLQTDRVFSYPSRLATDADYRIALDIRTFDGERGGSVELALAWSLVDDRSGAVLRTESARYQVQSAGPGVEAYVAALNDALAAFGNDLARQIAALPRRAGR